LIWRKLGMHAKKRRYKYTKTQSWIFTVLVWLTLRHTTNGTTTCIVIRLSNIFIGKRAYNAVRICIISCFFLLTNNVLIFLIVLYNTYYVTLRHKMYYHTSLSLINHYHCLNTRLLYICMFVWNKTGFVLY
jgi:hypothetical protein